MAEAVTTPDPAAPIVPAPDSAAPAQERPAWLPEGFDSPEALASAYAELKSQAPEVKPAESPADSPDASVAKFVQDAGFDPAALSKEIAANGDIGADAKAAIVAKLETVMGKDAATLVNDYIAGQKAVFDAGVNDIMSAAGGQQGYEEMSAWARENLSETDLKAFSDLMMKADVATAKLTVANLYARYQAEAAVPGQRVRGITGAGAGDVFKSFEQQKEAQRDPRYKADSAYREEVMQKVARSRQAGIY